MYTSNFCWSDSSIFVSHQGPSLRPPASLSAFFSFMACRAFLQEALRRSLTNLQSMCSHDDHGNGGHLPLHLLVAVVISIYQIEIHDSVLWDHSLLYIVLTHWIWSMLRSSNEISQSLVTVFFLTSPTPMPSNIHGLS